MEYSQRWLLIRRFMIWKLLTAQSEEIALLQLTTIEAVSTCKHQSSLTPLNDCLEARRGHSKDNVHVTHAQSDNLASSDDPEGSASDEEDDQLYPFFLSAIHILTHLEARPLSEQVALCDVGTNSLAEANRQRLNRAESNWSADEANRELSNSVNWSDEEDDYGRSLNDFGADSSSDEHEDALNGSDPSDETGALSVVEVNSSDDNHASSDVGASSFNASSEDDHALKDAESNVTAKEDARILKDLRTLTMNHSDVRTARDRAQQNAAVACSIGQCNNWKH